MMETSVLQQIQMELKAPKSQFNDFGKYNYRNAEDIQEALKPILANAGHSLTLTDEIVQIGDRIYVKATVKLLDQRLKLIVTTTAYAREPLTKKGMDEAQITGATSSYARKYALGGMFLLDDTKDADGMPPDTGKTPLEPTTKPPAKAAEKPKNAPSPIDLYLGTMRKAKETLSKLTGSDDAYYQALKLYGISHANEMKDLKEGKELIEDLRKFAKRAQEAKNDKKTTSGETPGNDGASFPPSEG